MPDVKIVPIHTERGDGLFRYLIGVTVITVIFPILRIWSRLVVIDPKVIRRFWWDDWFCFISVPFALASYITILYLTQIGLGMDSREIWAIDPYNLILVFKVMSAHYPAYIGAILFPKLSAICFYGRVLRNSGSRWYRIAFWLVIFVSVAMSVASIFINFFIFSPPKKAWYFWIPGTQGDTVGCWIGTTCVQLVLDLAVLLLPLPQLWGLQLPPRKKALLVGVFMFGYAAFITTIGRLVVLLKYQDQLRTDITYYMIDVYIWDQAWPLTAIMGICLPSIFSLVKRGIHGGPGALFHTRELTSIPTSGPSGSYGTHGSSSFNEKESRAWSPPLTKHRDVIPSEIPQTHQQTFMHINSSGVSSNNSSVWGMASRSSHDVEALPAMLGVGQAV